MRLGSIIKMALGAWLLAEFIVFFLLVESIGLGLTLLLGFATTCIGFLVLGKASRETLRQINSREPNGFTFVLLGPARIFAAILLILPGFVSDLIGLILATPLFGRVFSTTVSRRYATRQADIVDLDETEWRTSEEKTGRPTALPEKS